MNYNLVQNAAVTSRRIHPRVWTTSSTERSEMSGLCYGGGLRQINAEHSADRLGGAIRNHDHKPGSVRDSIRPKILQVVKWPDDC